MYNIYREKILKGFISIQYDGKKIVEEFSRHLAREILSLGTRCDNPEFPGDTVIVSETIWSYGNDHVVARKSSSGRSIDGE